MRSSPAQKAPAAAARRRTEVGQPAVERLDAEHAVGLVPVRQPAVGVACLDRAALGERKVRPYEKPFATFHVRLITAYSAVAGSRASAQRVLRRLDRRERRRQRGRGRRAVAPRPARRRRQRPSAAPSRATRRRRPPPPPPSPPPADRPRTRRRRTPVWSGGGGADAEKFCQASAAAAASGAARAGASDASDAELGARTGVSITGDVLGPR